MYDIRLCSDLYIAMIYYSFDVFNNNSYKEIKLINDCACIMCIEIYEFFFDESIYKNCPNSDGQHNTRLVESRDHAPPRGHVGLIFY